MSEPVLEVEDLTIKYRVDDGWVSAVSNASFTIEEGGYNGLVGESGCGKSTIAKAIIGGLDDNGEVTSGTIRYKGREIQDMTQQELNREIRWDEISLIPQSAMNSLDPVRRIDTQAVELAQVHTDMGKAEAIDRLRELFSVVGLQEERITDYPFEFSGGMQQRAIIAFSLLLDPSLIIADEPTTALDVIMQDQVFTYLDKVRDEFGTSMLLITHDISVVLESCDQVTVMHAGQVAETGSAIELYENPRHPYFILLKDAFPDIESPEDPLSIIEGEPPQLHGEVDFCTFADRCPWAVEECEEGMPPLEPADEDAPGHLASCIRKDEDLNAEYEERGADEIRADADAGIRGESDD
jgi:oligopeptide/dipeptide ABC transporter ATP-binding protein